MTENPGNGSDESVTEVKGYQSSPKMVFYTTYLPYLTTNGFFILMFFVFFGDIA